jgi:hypothetical protein
MRPCKLGPPFFAASSVDFLDSWDERRTSPGGPFAIARCPHKARRAAPNTALDMRLTMACRSVMNRERSLNKRAPERCCAPLSPRRSNAKRPTRRLGCSATSSGVNPSHRGADAHPNNRPKCFCQS